MSNKFGNWIEYWEKVSVGLENHINQSRNLDAEGYIRCCLGLFSFVTEDLAEKVTLRKDIVAHTYPLIIEMQDILRGTLVSQMQILLASSAFNLRTAFEIRCNLKYIFQHRNPEDLAVRLSDFFRYEQIVGSRLSPNLPYEGEAIERQFAAIHPYWAKANGLLKDNADWNGEDKNLKKICDDLSLQDEYFQMYKLTSKFLHGSPIVRNLYRRGGQMGCLADTKYPTMFSLMATHNICECLMEFCNFFGVGFPELDYRVIQQQMLKVQKMIES